MIIPGHLLYGVLRVPGHLLGLATGMRCHVLPGMDAAVLEVSGIRLLLLKGRLRLLLLLVVRGSIVLYLAVVLLLLGNVHMVPILALLCIRRLRACPLLSPTEASIAPRLRIRSCVAALAGKADVSK